MLEEESDTQPQKNYWRRSHDVIFLISLLASLLLLVALATYSANDPSWSVGNTKQVSNAAGIVGAYLADLLLQGFGFLAYVIPLLIIIKLVLMFRKRPSRNSLAWFVRSFGFLLTTAMCCVLAEMSIWQGEGLPAGAGGVLGHWLLSLLLPLFGFVGTAVVVSASVALGLMLYLEFSWLQLFEKLGGWVLRLATKQKEDKELQGSEGTRINNGSQAELEPPLLSDTFFTTEDQELNAPYADDNEPWLMDELAAPKRLIRRAKTESKPVNEIPIEPLPKRNSGPSQRAQFDLQGKLFDRHQTLPSIGLLNQPKKNTKSGFSPERLQELSKLLVQKLADFGVKVEVTAVAPGPVITRFEIQPAPGVKASKITNLARDLARSMAMLSVRVVEVIPGKSVMGIEIPNEDRAIVSLFEVLSSPEYDQSKSPLTLALGHDIGGNPITADLGKMPHLLVAGTTGSGKSVGVNAMIISILLKSTPEQVRMILIDPKMLELSVYGGIPHLLTPVVTDMKEAASALRWSVTEMDRRYELMSKLGVRNLAGFNKKVKDAIEAGQPIADPLWRIEQSFETQPPLLEPLPHIVIVIDEFADMIMVVGKKVEELIARIAQKARAAGVHMILATQRPSVDVITGLIKANIPTRIAFQVSSKIDSRTILDQGGAEQLLGHGDMLFMPPGVAQPERVHGAFVDDDEVHRVVAEWKLRAEPKYIEEITCYDEEGGAVMGDSSDGEQDELYDLAVAFITESGKCSISSVQRKLRIGYNRAARLVESMQAAGVVSAPAHNGAREVLASAPPEY